MQPLLESRVTAAALDAVPLAGRLVSHSFVYSARVPRP
jgi:hypothetical protein